MGGLAASDDAPTASSSGRAQANMAQILQDLTQGVVGTNGAHSLPDQSDPQVYGSLTFIHISDFINIVPALSERSVVVSDKFEMDVRNSAAKKPKVENNY